MEEEKKFYPITVNDGTVINSREEYEAYFEWHSIHGEKYAVEPEQLENIINAYNEINGR